MTTLADELELTVAALADSYNQTVFLEHIMNLAAKAGEPNDLLVVLEHARLQIGCQGAALYLDAWQNTVPEWLVEFQLPNRRMQFPKHQLLAVPVLHGWVAFWGKTSYSAQDIRTAEIVANIFETKLQSLEAQHLREQAKIEEHERQVAGNLWRELVPATLPAPLGYKLWCWSEPAREVGGDFQCASSNWRVLGDVSGKGLPAALFTGILTAVLPIALKTSNPGLSLQQSVGNQLENSGMFSTLVAQQFEHDGNVNYFNLGHPPTLIRRKDGSVESLKATMPPLGLFAPPRYRYGQYNLKSGEYAITYSDGVIEACQDETLFGLERLSQMVELFSDPVEFMSHLEQTLKTWEIGDDLSLQVVQFVGAS